MTLLRHSAAGRLAGAVLVSAFICMPALAQTTSPTAIPTPAPTHTPQQAAPPITSTFNRTVIFLDPAHGGRDSGALLSGQVFEKDVTLALANRLRSLLSARGFTVLQSRQADVQNPAPNLTPGVAQNLVPTTPLTFDDRAGAANHTHAVACIILHATASGHGVHLYISALTPPDAEPHPLPWDTAQGPWIPQSLRLANELGTALSRAHIPLVLGRVAIRPLDNLTCPAVALEIAPLPVDGEDDAPVTNAVYQQRVSEALVNALMFWRGHADPVLKPTPPPTTPPATSPIPPTAPKTVPGITPSTPAAKPQPPATRTPAALVPITPKPKPQPVANPSPEDATTGVSNPPPEPAP